MVAEVEAAEEYQLGVVVSEKMVAINAAAAVAEAVPVYVVGSKLEIGGSVGNEGNSDHGPADESAVVAQHHSDQYQSLISFEHAMHHQHQSQVVMLHLKTSVSAPALGVDFAA